jgi:hypothetical protein
MKGSKQSRTDLLEKKLQATINIIKQLLDENAYLKDLAVGTLETIKCMPDYDEAIEKLKEQVAKESSKTEETKPLEETIN